eukprot:CAMPEP_0184472050 /NCGR_PEP_ID=MMETSP0740-20130409/107675_1 /TAXON_ID=385413 /ORGANISM="Thalassiosira miniscula, Strain CCMP1093" /LENGTH=31 /DNA_ID= /DNA_START= /DNA_END= /DNA_ORIENTATION=
MIDAERKLPAQHDILESGFILHDDSICAINK